MIWSIFKDRIPLIPSLLSPMTTHIGLQFLERNPHKVEVASLITALPALCPNLQNIQLEGLPRDPVITAAVSELLLSISRNNFRTFSVDSPLTEKDREVIYKLPDLRKLSIVLDSPTPLPTIILQKLLPLTQLKELVIGFSCEPSCSSTIDDDTITDLARALPNLEVLHIGNAPCKTLAGITVKGLSALAHYSLHLNDLCIHFQLASLNPPRIPLFPSVDESPIPRKDCPLEVLHVGNTRMPWQSALMVALTLTYLFPHLKRIKYKNHGWSEVSKAIRNSKNLVNRSSKNVYLFLKPDH